MSYANLIRAAYYPQLWHNARGISTAATPTVTPCCTRTSARARPRFPFSPNGAVTRRTPLIRSTTTSSRIANGPANATNTNQFTQMEANFSLFWGLSVQTWVQILVPDNTPFDQFLESNPDAFMSLGDTSEALLVDDLLNCTTPTPAQLLPRARPVQARSRRGRAHRRDRRGRRGGNGNAAPAERVSPAIRIRCSAWTSSSRRTSR